MLIAVIHGFILSLGLILPLGPQNVFIFNQGVRTQRITEVLAAILAASLSDTLLIYLAVSGASLLVFSYPWLQNLILGAGLIFLIWIGASIWNGSSVHHDKDPDRLPVKKQITFALSVSLLNPHAILDTIGVIGTNALQYPGNAKWTFAAACASVSWIWFFGLAFAGHLIGKTTGGARMVNSINKLSALIIWGIAGYLAANIFYSYLN